MDKRGADGQEGIHLMSDPRLKRGIFGYTAESVRLLLADRDRMFLQVTEDAKAAETRVVQLQAMVDNAEKELTAGTEELRTVLEEANSLRSELELARADLEEAGALARRNEAAAAELAEARSELDREADRARFAEAEAARLRDELEQINQDLRRREERASVEEARAADLQSELERLQGQIGSDRRERESALRDGEAAEARIRAIETELASARAELEASQRDVAVLRAQVGQPPASAASVRPPAPGAPTAKDVSILLQSTEETMARIIQEAKARTDAELDEAERAWAKVQEDTRRLKAWRDRVAPLVGEFRNTVEEARGRATELRDQVREALAPMTDAVEALSIRLEELARVAQPAPGSLQPVGDDAEAPRVIEIRDPEGATDTPRAPRGGSPQGGRPW